MKRNLEIVSSDQGSSSSSNQTRWWTLVNDVVRILRSQKTEWLQNLVEYLSKSWNPPNQADVRIQIGDRHYYSTDYKNSPYGLITPFKLNNGELGLIQISYPENISQPNEEEAFHVIRETICLAIDSAHIKEQTLSTENVQSSNERIRDLAGRLIQAQEAERTRIARELHDNVNQRIAALSISLSNVKKSMQDSAPNALDEISLLQLKLSEIAEEIRGVSHQLHSGVLQHAGLVMAARTLCNEFSAKSEIELQFVTGGDVDSVSGEVALCIYRIIQEAIHNIQMHARAKHAKVCLVRSASSLSLLVSDDGCGFDQNEPGKHKGLGLLSMNERVRLVRGRISIDSRKFQGTQIVVEVPI